MDPDYYAKVTLTYRLMVGEGLHQRLVQAGRGLLWFSGMYHFSSFFPCCFPSLIECLRWFRSGKLTLVYPYRVVYKSSVKDSRVWWFRFRSCTKIHTLISWIFHAARQLQVSLSVFTGGAKGFLVPGSWWVRIKLGSSTSTVQGELFSLSTVLNVTWNKYKYSTVLYSASEDTVQYSIAVQYCTAK